MSSILNLSSRSHVGSFVEKGEQKKGQNPICVYVWLWVGTGSRRGKITCQIFQTWAFLFQKGVWNHVLWCNGDILFLLKIDLIPFKQLGIPFRLSHVIK